jgi:hypothetical protein
MVFVELFRRVFRLQYFPLVVTLQTGILRDMTVAGYHSRMAGVALDPSLDIPLMVEGETCNGYVSLRLVMAGGTARDNFLLILRLVEVAYKTLYVCNRDMGALDDLRMTGGAAKLLLSPHLLKMGQMVKDYVLKDKGIFQGRFVVALEATCVIDLCMGFRDLLSCNEINEGYLAVFPLSLQMVDESRFVMAVDTGYVLMVRCLPRIDINGHVVADTAEKRLLRYLVCGSTYDDKTESDKGDKNRHTRGVPFRPFFRFFVKVPQERSDEFKQISERSGIVLFHNPPTKNSLKGQTG